MRSFGGGKWKAVGRDRGEPDTNPQLLRARANNGWTRPYAGEATSSGRFAASLVQDFWGDPSQVILALARRVGGEIDGSMPRERNPRGADWAVYMDIGRGARNSCLGGGRE